MRFFVYVFIITILLLAPQWTQAHFHQTLRDITVMIHIDPKEQPVAGEASTIMVQITHPDRSIAPNTCVCTLTIYRNHKRIHSAPLFDPITDLPYIPFTFPETGIYTLEVSGTPVRNGIFDPFTASYNVRVDQTQQAYKHHTRGIWYGMLAFTTLAATGMIIRSWIRRSGKKK